MKQIIIGLVALWGINSVLLSQSSIEDILAEVEKNNTTLSALRLSADAEKTGNLTGLYPQNPEIGFEYLWGSPSVIGNRTGLTFIQSFDFPSTYRYQNQISQIRNEQVELEYLKQQKELTLQTRLLLYELIYLNAMELEQTHRLSHAKRIASSYKTKFDIGDVSILEFNKAQIYLLNIRKELELTEIDKDASSSELARLNGGKPIIFTTSKYQTPSIPNNFEEWYVEAEQNNPILNWLKQEIELSRKQQKLSSAKALPKINAGYMSEKVIGQKYQGITVGLSIPLWENKNEVKYARANSIAIEGIEADNKIQFYNQLKILHSKAVSMQINASDYRTTLMEYDNSALLQIALEKGEINLINYILELTIYYESIDNVLELEREMNKTVAELKRFE